MATKLAPGHEAPAAAAVDVGGIDEPALRQLVDAATAIRRSDDAEQILSILVSAVQIVAPTASVWAAVQRQGAQGEDRGSGETTLVWSGHGATELDISEIFDAWSPRLGEGLPPFLADVSGTPLADAEPGLSSDALTVFPMGSGSRLAALVVGLRLSQLPPASRSVLGLLCHECSLALQLGNVSAAAHHTEGLLGTLTQLSASYSDAPLVLETIVRRTAELLGMDAAWVMLADAQKQRLQATSAFGITSGAFRDLSISVDDRLPGRAIRSRRAVCLRDVQDEEQSEYSRPEGLRTVMCAPMFVEDELVGVLVAAHREVHEASTEDFRTLEALASAAAVSITNARVFVEREEYSLALQRTQRFQKDLAALMLSGSSLDEIVAMIAETLSCEVLVLDRDLTVLHRSGGQQVQGKDLDPKELATAIFSSDEALAGGSITRLTVARDDGNIAVAVAPLDLSGERTAFVVIAEEEPGPDDGALDMTEAAVTTIGLELMRDRAATEAEARLAGGLFSTLLSDPGVDESNIKRRASYLGYELTGSNLVIAVGLPADKARGQGDDLVGLRTSVQRGVRRHRNPPTAIFEHKDAVYVLLCNAQEMTEASIGEHCSLIESELRASEHHNDAFIALAGPHEDIAGLRQAVREASHALTVLHVTGASGKRVAYEDLGVWTLLGSLGTGEELRAFAHRVLGTLIEHDEQRQTNFVETVRALVQSNFQLRPAAERLYVHTNTLRYRVPRISELTGLDFDSPDDRLKVDMSLRILDVLGPEGASAEHPDAESR